jgi:hypothetical protein
LQIKQIGPFLVLDFTELHNNSSSEISAIIRQQKMAYLKINTPQKSRVPDKLLIKGKACFISKIIQGMFKCQSKRLESQKHKQSRRLSFDLFVVRLLQTN